MFAIKRIYKMILPESGMVINEYEMSEMIYKQGGRFLWNQVQGFRFYYVKCSETEKIEIQKILAGMGISLSEKPISLTERILAGI